MSHLPHVSAFKAKLVSLGVTCPEELARVSSEPYVNAILRKHFKLCNALGISEAEEDDIWKQLDCWNRVQPINASLIFATVKARIDSIRVQLIKGGMLPAQFTTVATLASQETVDVTQNEEFEILVAHLYNELVNYHE